MALSALDNEKMSRPAISLAPTVLALVALCFASSVAMYAQASGGNSGTVRGTVLDPSGAVIMGATVEIENPVSHYTQTAQTDDQGNFELKNVPYNNYHLSASAAGFQAGETRRGCALAHPGSGEGQPEHRHRGI